MANCEYPALNEVWMEPDAIMGRVWTHLNELTVSSDTMLLFYTALELRFFVESVLFALLCEMKGDCITKRDRKTYRAKEFHRVFQEVDEQEIRSASRALGWDIGILEIELAGRVYGQLGAQLHLPKAFLAVDDQSLPLETLEEQVLDAAETLRRIIGYEWP